MSGLKLKLLVSGLFFGSYQVVSWWMQKSAIPSFYLNQEAIFGLVSHPQVIAAVALVAVMLLVKLFQSGVGSLGQWGLVLITAGGLSNLLDRLIYGGVIDYFRFGLWSTFNLADVSIVVGAILIAFDKPSLKPLASLSSPVEPKP